MYHCKDHTQPCFRPVKFSMAFIEITFAKRKCAITALKLKIRKYTFRNILYSCKPVVYSKFNTVTSLKVYFYKLKTGQI